MSNDLAVQNVLTPLPQLKRQSFRAEALFVGQRIDVRALSAHHNTNWPGPGVPTIIPAGSAGWAVVFRYGAVTLFDVADAERRAFVESLSDFLVQAYDQPEHEEVDVRVDPQRSEGVHEQVVIVRDPSGERLQVVAEVLARSVVLAHYEGQVARVFDRIEPLAADLERHGRPGLRVRHLLRQIGGTLLIQHKMVGRVEVTEKPELLWEHPELERLFVRLAEEYELQDRQLALDRKLELISTTAQTLVDLLQNRRSLRVEWYIVILIVVEIMLSLYSMFFSA